jgi:AcrR family transcriptional regulator
MRPARDGDAPRPRRRSDGEASRRAILDAAIASFRKNGFDATTMRDVARDAGVALGAAYYYFPSKEAVVLAYYDETERLHEERTKIALEKERTLRGRIGVVVHAKIDLLSRDRKLLGALFRRLADPDDDVSIFGAATADVRVRSVATFDRALGDAPFDGETRAVVALAFWALHLGHILFLVHDRSRGHAKTRALVDTSLDFACSLAESPLASMIAQQLSPMLRDAGLLEQK